MNISFDLDSTLIPNGEEFETEKTSKISQILGIERIRKGSVQLITDLQNDGHNVHIYTTSFRPRAKIRWLLRYHGIKVGRIINETENIKVLKSLNIISSKYPPAFKFDIHIDDSKGVGIESERLDFKVIIVEPSDENWDKKVKRIINNKIS
ncbi:MAG: HAD family hydrolase [Bacteroidota bacterium]